MEGLRNVAGSELKSHSMESSLQISVIVPVYNSAHTLRELVHRLRVVFEKAGTAFEIIFIDDGSRDDSWR